MGLGDRLRAWLRGEDEGPSGPGAAGRSSDRSAGRSRAAGPERSGRSGGGRRRGRAGHPSAPLDAPELDEFLRTRRGVELYLEPRTRLYGDSVLLVADDGEYLRRPVPDAAAARRWAGEHGVPVYDAARTGYPRRVRDYDRGVRSERIELDDLPPWPGSEPSGSDTPSDTPVGDTPSVTPDGDTPSVTPDDEEEPPPPPPDAQG